MSNLIRDDEDYDDNDVNVKRRKLESSFQSSTINSNPNQSFLISSIHTIQGKIYELNKYIDLLKTYDEHVSNMSTILAETPMQSELLEYVYSVCQQNSSVVVIKSMQDELVILSCALKVIQSLTSATPNRPTDLSSAIGEDYLSNNIIHLTQITASQNERLYIHTISYINDLLDGRLVIVPTPIEISIQPGEKKPGEEPSSPIDMDIDISSTPSSLPSHISPIVEDHDDDNIMMDHEEKEEEKKNQPATSDSGSHIIESDEEPYAVEMDQDENPTESSGSHIIEDEEEGEKHSGGGKWSTNGSSLTNTDSSTSISTTVSNTSSNVSEVSLCNGEIYNYGASVPALLMKNIFNIRKSDNEWIHDFVNVNASTYDSIGFVYSKSIPVLESYFLSSAYKSGAKIEGINIADLLNSLQLNPNANGEDREWTYSISMMGLLSQCNKFQELQFIKYKKLKMGQDLNFDDVKKLSDLGYIFLFPNDDDPTDKSSGFPNYTPYFYMSSDGNVAVTPGMIEKDKFTFALRDNATRDKNCIVAIVPEDEREHPLAPPLNEFVGFSSDSLQSKLLINCEDIKFGAGTLDPSTQPTGIPYGSFHNIPVRFTEDVVPDESTRAKVTRIQRIQDFNDIFAVTSMEAMVDGIYSFSRMFGSDMKLANELYTSSDIRTQLLALESRFIDNGQIQNADNTSNFTPTELAVLHNYQLRKGKTLVFYQDPSEELVNKNNFKGVQMFFAERDTALHGPPSNIHIEADPADGYTLRSGDTTITTLTILINECNGIISLESFIRQIEMVQLDKVAIVGGKTFGITKDMKKKWERVCQFAKQVLLGIPRDLLNSIVSAIDPKDYSNGINQFFTQIVISEKAFGDSYQIFYASRMNPMCAKYEVFTNLKTSDKLVMYESFGAAHTNCFGIGTRTRPPVEIASDSMFFGSRGFSQWTASLGIQGNFKQDENDLYNTFSAISTNVTQNNVDELLKPLKNVLFRIESELIPEDSINSTAIAKEDTEIQASNSELNEAISEAFSSPDRIQVTITEIDDPTNDINAFLTELEPTPYEELKTYFTTVVQSYLQPYIEDSSSFLQESDSLFQNLQLYYNGDNSTELKSTIKKDILMIRSLLKDVLDVILTVKTSGTTLLHDDQSMVQPMDIIPEPTEESTTSIKTPTAAEPLNDLLQIKVNSLLSALDIQRTNMGKIAKTLKLTRRDDDATRAIQTDLNKMTTIFEKSAKVKNLLDDKVNERYSGCQNYFIEIVNQFNNDSKEYLNVALNKIATLDALEQKANEIKESRGRERKPPAAAAGVLTGKAAEGAGGLDIINADIAQEIAELKSNAQILSEELKKKQLIVEELRELNKKRKQKSFVDMIASKLRSVTGITVSNFDAEYKKAIQDKKQSEAERKMMDNVIAAKEKKMAANNVKIEKDMTSSASAESSTAKAKEAVNAMFQSFTNSCQTTLGKIGALMTTQSSISSNKKRARPAGGRSIETRKKKIERFIKMTRKRIVHKTSNKKITRRVNKKARKQSHTHTHTRTHNRNKKETTTSRGYKKRTTHNKTIKRNTNNKRRHK